MDLLTVCRVCLCRNVRMYSILQHKLRNAYEQLTGALIRAEDKLPQKMCWECLARFSAADRIIQKALTTQQILMDMVETGRVITIEDIESIDRSKNGLASTLTKSKINESNSYIVENVKVELDEELIRSDSNDEDVRETPANYEFTIENIKEESNIGDDGPLMGIELSNLEKSGGLKEKGNNFRITDEYSNQIGIKSENTIFDPDCSKKYRNTSVSRAMMLQDLPQYNEQNNSEQISCDDLSTKEIKIEYLNEADTSKNDIKDENFVDIEIEEEDIRAKIKQSSSKNNPDKSQNVPVTETKKVYPIAISKSAKNDYKCNICDATFKIRQSYTNHLRAHSQTFYCSFCDFKSSHKKDLEKHVNGKHTKTTSFNCSHCTYTTYYLSDLKKHVNAKHTKNDSLNCPHCDYKAYYQTNLNSHINAIHNKTKNFDCPHCTFKSYYKSHLYRHVKRVHSDSKSKIIHMKHRCKQCSFKTFHSTALEIHVNAVHTKDSSFICDTCDFKTYYRSYLVKHIMAKHMNIKKGERIRFYCADCDYKTYQKNQLLCHNRKKHSVINITINKIKKCKPKNFKCDFCEYKTSNRHHFDCHVNCKHTKAYVLSCPHCDYKNYYDRHQILKHISIVHPEKSKIKIKISRERNPSGTDETPQ